MATYAHRGKTWRAQVRVRGVVESATFRTKQEAQAWAAEREGEIRRGAGGSRSTTLRDALQAFQRDVCPGRRGGHWERLRIDAMLAGELRKVAPLPLRAIAPDHLAAYRDARLKAVAPGTVLRELALLSGIFEWARLTKRWIASNPIHDIAKPSQPAPRTRLITADEERRILLALGYEGGSPATPSQEVALAFLIALETAMRSGEILGLRPAHFDAAHKVAHILLSKNGKPRDVPLTSKAVELWGRLPAGHFTISDESRDVLFRRAVAACKIQDLHFHDTRATALTRLARLVDVMTLARISGHRDIKTLFATYYREPAEQIAARLDAVTSADARVRTPKARRGTTAAKGTRRSTR